MQKGIYEQIVSLVLQRQLENHPSVTEELDSADSHSYLAQYLYRVLNQGLAQVRAKPRSKNQKENNDNRIRRQINICNEIIECLNKAGIEGLNDDKVSSEALRLLAILDEAASNTQHPARPGPLARRSDYHCQQRPSRFDSYCHLSVLHDVSHHGKNRFHRSPQSRQKH